MALVSFPTINTFNTSGLSFTSQALTTLDNSFSRRNSHNKGSVFRSFHSPFLYQPLNHHTIFSPKCTGQYLVLFKACKNSAPGGGEDFQALETVLRLYTAIKNKNIHELSDQVLDFFSYLIRNLGNHIEIIVTPTIQDGMNVGIQWRLECNKTHVPLGKGFSFHICHVYQGKVVIRNVEMFLEPLLHFEPFRLKIIGYVTTVMDKLSSKPILRNKPKRATYILLSLFIMTLLFSFTLH
ncbi:hypothetical protein TorRG33x02_129370 [Trema orientale]|uniref:Transmembrane protein n=1 Tax=Trema orientale TaxID=63057 RepID=A0A2P5F0R0_TREOI|nr:hypothetical protein TorRG33x02_129370 [Trema orientale]